MNLLTRGIAVSLILLCSAARSAGPDVNALISKLARVPPATIAFTEARFSALLREPVIVAGELSYLGPGSFERRVTLPYRETTAIHGESVRIEREGEASRTFGLKRAPELGGLLSGFAALLSGDAAAVAREFSVASTGDEQSWALELTPLTRNDRRRLRQILVSGAESETRCFAVVSEQGSASVMLLGSAAAQPIAADATLDALLRRCRVE